MGLDIIFILANAILITGVWYIGFRDGRRVQRRIQTQVAGDGSVQVQAGGDLVGYHRAA